MEVLMFICGLLTGLSIAFFALLYMSYKIAKNDKVKEEDSADWWKKPKTDEGEY